MSGVGGRDGVDIRAGGGVFDEVDEDLRRGEGGYEDGAETNPGGVGEVSGAVKRLIEALEKRIKELEKQVQTMRGNNALEFVNVKQMTPTVLKEGVAFRIWREEFERWSGIKVDECKRC